MRNLLCILLLVLTLSVSAQKTYFIYLQTDNGNPFYVKMADKIYSSSSSGYLILPNLSDSTYYFTVGFPSNQTESKFTVRTEGRDKGFLIKNLQPGLSLFDLQTSSLINEQKAQVPDTISHQKRTDDFASILSKAANDTSLLYATVKKEEPFGKQQTVAEESKTKNIQQKEEDTKVMTQPSDVRDTMAATAYQTTTSEIKTQDTTAIAKTKAEDIQRTKQQTASPEISLIKQTPKADTITTNTIERAKAETFKRSNIKKHSESSTSEGFGLVYYDQYEEGADTIRLIIPNPKFTIKRTDSDTSQSDQFLKREEIKPSASNKETAVNENNIVRQPAITSALKPNCKAVATDNDFFKLRKVMAAKETDEAMIEEAKKAFRTKCFTTEQIKNLSTLFLTSAGKYQFFDAAYFHSTDPQQFPSLQSEIRDDYYLKRFKALVGE